MNICSVMQEEKTVKTMRNIRYTVFLRLSKFIAMIALAAFMLIQVSCKPPTGAATLQLPAPLNVVATALSSSSIHIDWDDVPGARGYHIYRCRTRDGSFLRANIDLLISSEYTDDSLVSDSEYWYAVAAVADGRSHEQSDPCSGTTNLSVPTGITVSALIPGELAIAWNDVDNADGYNIYRLDSYSGTYTRLNPTPLVSPDFSDSGLDDLTIYWYEIAAIRGGVEQDRSTPARGITMVGPLDIDSVSYLSPSALRITWTSHGSSLQYLVHRATGSDGPYTRVTPSPVSGTTFDDIGLAGDTEYWYRLDAVRDGIPQSPGNPLSGLTSPFWVRTYEPTDGAEAAVLLAQRTGCVVEALERIEPVASAGARRQRTHATVGDGDIDVAIVQALYAPVVASRGGRVRLEHVGVQVPMPVDGEVVGMGAFPRAVVVAPVGEAIVSIALAHPFGI